MLTSFLKISNVLHDYIYCSIIESLFLLLLFWLTSTEDYSLTFQKRFIFAKNKHEYSYFLLWAFIVL